MEVENLVNLAEIVATAARDYGDRPAVVDGDVTLSFRDVDERSGRLGAALVDRGCAVGDRVAVLVGNRFDWFDATFGIMKAGLVRVFLNPRSAPAEIEHQIRDSGATKLLVSSEYRPLIEGVDLAAVDEVLVLDETPLATDPAIAPITPVPLDDDALCALMYTSGTTGRAKGAMQSHGAWGAVTSAFLTEVGVGDDEVVLHVAPMGHASGGIVLPTMVRGARNVVFRGFDPVEMLNAIPEHGVTTIFMVPTMLYLLLELIDQLKVDTSSLRTVVYGASPIAPAKLERCLEILGDVFIQGYAMTESVVGTYLPKRDHVPGSPRLLSAGRPAPNVEMQIAGDDDALLPVGEVGEILVRGPQLMQGYWNQPIANAERFTADGWFRTADLGRFDEDGYLYIVDRKADMIVSGGYNVYPAEVEGTLAAHPAVAEVAVVAAPDEQWGERVVAVVRLTAETDVPESELEAFCRERIAGYKVPKQYEFRAEELPKSPTGKVLRREVRAPFWANTDRGVS